MKKLLLVIDYQVDFVASHGRLTIGEPGQAIEQALLAKVRQYEREKQEIVFTLDSHERSDWKRHPESRNFDLHCEVGTEGWRLYGALEDYMESGCALISKKSFCMDTGKIKEIVVRGYDGIELCGVATDVCVLQTMIVLYTELVNAQIDTQLVLDAHCCASLREQGQEYALRYMKDVLDVSILNFL